LIYHLSSDREMQLDQGRANYCNALLTATRLYWSGSNPFCLNLKEFVRIFFFAFCAVGSLDTWVAAPPRVGMIYTRLLILDCLIYPCQ
jgi:hypothetical protein